MVGRILSKSGFHARQKSVQVQKSLEYSENVATAGLKRSYNIISKSKSKSVKSHPLFPKHTTHQNVNSNPHTSCGHDCEYPKRITTSRKKVPRTNQFSLLNTVLVDERARKGEPSVAEKKKERPTIAGISQHVPRPHHSGHDHDVNGLSHLFLFAFAQPVQGRKWNSNEMVQLR